MSELAFQSSTELLKAIQDRNISSVELLNHYSERFERLNPDINAIVAADFDALLCPSVSVTVSKYDHRDFFDRT